MKTYSLGKFPNQSFSVSAGGIVINFKLHTYRGIIYADVMIDNATVCAGVRCANDNYILPAHWQRMAGGNFRFHDINGDYPNCQNFDGTTCLFIFDSEDEMLK